jgi:uncharacterized protein YjbJ (UPF0337 family)
MKAHLSRARPKAISSSSVIADRHRRLRVNEDTVLGSARNVIGKAEHGLGDAVGSDKLRGDGVVDQASGAIQHGYGIVKDTVSDVLDDAPGVIAGAVGRTRKLARQGDEAVRDQLGNNGPLYLLAGAVALFALGALTFGRSAPAQPAKRAKQRSNVKTHA